MNRLNQLFNVRPNEWRRLAFISLVMILSNIGTNWGTTAVYAAFTTQAGIENGRTTLIWVLMISALLSVPILAIYTAFADRVNHNRMFIYIVVAGGAVIVVGLVLLGLGMATLALPFIYILSQAWLAVFNPHFYTYVNDLFDIQSAKRALPLILAGGRIGAALAGFSLPSLSAAASTETIIWIWLFSDLAVIGLLAAIPRFLKKESGSANARIPHQKTPENFFANLKEGLTFTKQSAFLRWMAFRTLLLAALLSLLEYFANRILAPMYQEPGSYTGFLGVLDGVSNLIALLILLFFVNRMTKSWGVANASLGYPFLTFFIAGGLVAFPAWLTASLANLNRKGLRFSLYAPIEALLYNAIPLRVKVRARAFVSGLLFPLGAILGMLIPLFQTIPGVQADWLLPAAIVFFMLAFVFGMFMTRYHYSQALVKMLEEEDYSFLMSEASSELNAADPAALQKMKVKLEQSASHEIRVFIAQVMAQSGGEEALPILIPAVKNTAEARTRAAMLEVIIAAGLRGDALRDLCADFLAQPDAHLRQSAAAAMEQILGAQDPWLHDLWVSMVNDPDPNISFQALKSLAQTGKFFAFEAAVWKLDDLMKSPAAEDKTRAVQILSLVGDAKSTRQLLEFLTEPEDALRLEAALSLEKAKLPLGMSLDDDILDFAKLLQQDPVARIRQSALVILSKYHKAEFLPLFVSALGDKNAQTRAEAVAQLAAMGKPAIPLLQEQLRVENRAARKMAAAALSRINPRQFSAWIEKNVSENLSDIYQSISVEDALSPYQNHRSARALISSLRERSHEWIDEILYLLSAIHDAQTLKVVGESLNSDSAVTRNLALEALESLTSPQTAALIASLFEELAPSQLLKLSEGTLAVERLDLPRAFEALTARQDEEVALLLALHSMGDVGAQLVTQGNLTWAGKLLAMLESFEASPAALIRVTAQESIQKIHAAQNVALLPSGKPLSLVEKMIILKEAPFFRNIPTRDLAAMARISEEKTYEVGARIFNTGDPGGALYMIVNGQVKIEQEKRGGNTLLATLENDSSFGEMSLFDDSPRSASAIAARRSSILEVKRAPITSLTMQNPDMALELITVLSQRIRETSEKLAEMTRSRPRELHKLFDQFESEKS